MSDEPLAPPDAEVVIENATSDEVSITFNVLAWSDTAAEQADALARQLEAAGFRVTDEPSPFLAHSLQHMVNWALSYSLTVIVDHTIGAPVSRGVRRSVELAVDAFRRQYPHLSIHIDDYTPGGDDIDDN